MIKRFTAILAAVLLLALVVATPTMAAGENAQGRCIREAAQAGLIGRDTNPSNTNFVAGTEGDDNFTNRATAGRDVFCGFAGDDYILELGEGDLFLGGAGNDEVGFLESGTFDGREGNDEVGYQLGGTFDGGEGDDFVVDLYSGTFNGGAGNDEVRHLLGGTFNGGAGDDTVSLWDSGTFNQD